MLNLSQLAKLRLIFRTRLWLSASIPTATKLKYFPAVGVSYLRMILTGNKTISYLGTKLKFDNVASPFSLQAYPFEIANKILANMPSKPATVLDVGGNIGQFSITMSALMGGKVSIDILEPNPEAYSMLQDNIVPLSNLTSYNTGVGKAGKHDLFFNQGQSATGSLLKNNAGEKGASTTRKISINLTDKVALLTGRKDYDLVKIDVEGYEIEALEGLKGIKPKFLYIEVSGLGRGKNYLHSELLQAIADRFGKFDVYYLSSADSGSINFEALLGF